MAGLFRTWNTYSNLQPVRDERTQRPENQAAELVLGDQGSKAGAAQHNQTRRYTSLRLRPGRSRYAAGVSRPHTCLAVLFFVCVLPACGAQEARPVTVAGLERAGRFAWTDVRDLRTAR
jgi:hypothetical protein